MVRVAGAGALWNIERKAEEVLPVLIAAAESAPGATRIEALRALSEMGKRASGAVSAVTVLLKDPNREVQVQAAWALWRMTRKSQPTVSVFVRALRDEKTPDRQTPAV